MRRLSLGSDFTPGATKILDPVVIRRQRERMEAARVALEPLLELAQKANAEADRGMTWGEIEDLPWAKPWVCIQEDLKTAMEHLEAK